MTGNQNCILVVDDDKRMRKAIVDFFTYRNYKMIEAGDGKEALDIFEKFADTIDLILLDIMMPGKDGIMVLGEVRELSDIPVILLTAKDKETDQITGFRQGADDYVIKPFSPTLLVARVESVLKRTKKQGYEVLKEGELLIDPLKRQIFINEKEVYLSLKEFDLLFFLVKNKGVALTREQILNAVWDFRYEGDGRTVDTHIKQLRAKLSEYPCIKTVHRVGYKFETEGSK